MARYKNTDYAQGLILPVNLSEQIIKGTYEYTLKMLIDEKLDLSIFDLRYNNDETGAPAIESRILLKIILYCYNMGVISSRKIAKLCESHMTVKALAEDTEPHYTTISNFVSGRCEEIAKAFTEVLLVCDDLKLLGGKMSAIDGCKLPSNASKEWSGTKAELQEKYEKLKKISKKIVEKHKKNDRIGKKETEADMKKLETLDKKADKILKFLNTHEDRVGAGGEIIKSNITDNESGKIQCSKGVIQGYNGMAVADSKNQVILAADAYGTVAEGQFFGEMMEQTESNLHEVTGEAEPLKGTVILADTAHFSEGNLQFAKEKGMEAVIPDQQYRNRDEDLKEGEPLVRERREGKEKFDARHFEYNKKKDSYTCPNEKKLSYKRTVTLNRSEGKHYESTAHDCAGCPFFDQCIRTKKKDSGKKQKKYRTLYIPITKYEENLSQKMREKIDTPRYKRIYSVRLGMIEPVFANITYCKGITRFTLRGQKKVSTQWRLYCIVHNIGKCNMAKNRKKLKKAG